MFIKHLVNQPNPSGFVWAKKKHVVKRAILFVLVFVSYSRNIPRRPKRMIKTERKLLAKVITSMIDPFLERKERGSIEPLSSSLLFDWSRIQETSGG